MRSAYAWAAAPKEPAAITTKRMEKRNPFRTTWKPWLKPLLVGIYVGELHRSLVCSVVPKRISSIHSTTATTATATAATTAAASASAVDANLLGPRFTSPEILNPQSQSITFMYEKRMPAWVWHMCFH